MNSHGYIHFNSGLWCVCVHVCALILIEMNVPDILDKHKQFVYVHESIMYL